MLSVGWTEDDDRFIAVENLQRIGYGIVAPTILGIGVVGGLANMATLSNRTKFRGRFYTYIRQDFFLFIFNRQRNDPFVVVFQGTRYGRFCCHKCECVWDAEHPDLKHLRVPVQRVFRHNRSRSRTGFIFLAYLYVAVWTKSWCHKTSRISMRTEKTSSCKRNEMSWLFSFVFNGKWDVWEGALIPHKAL